MWESEDVDAPDTAKMRESRGRSVDHILAHEISATLEKTWL